MPSGSIEDYLKQIYQLQGQGERVSTSALAERLAISSAAVSEMIKRLATQNLLTHAPYRGVELTEAGLAEAIGITRRHRLWEQFLVEKLGFGWDEVHELAEQLEHVRSVKLEARLAEFLDHPAHDPHGDPIPAADGSLPTDPTLCALDDWAPGRRGLIARVSDDPDLLRYLAERELRPGVGIELIRRDPFGGPLVVRTDGGATHHLGSGAAQHIFITEPTG